MTRKERAYCCGKSFLLFASISYLFYRSLVLSILLAVLYSLYALKSGYKTWLERRKWQLNIEFKDGLVSIAAALNAGYAIENCFQEAIKDLKLLYGEESLLIPEFLWIREQLRLNQPIEQVLGDFANRCQVEDIQNFVQVFQTAKRTGGDLIAITRATSNRICEKVEINREIKSMIAGKQMEGQVMNMIPLGIILYFWICSPGFLDYLYQSFQGRVYMSILLGIYMFAYNWSKKIASIEV